MRGQGQAPSREAHDSVTGQQDRLHIGADEIAEGLTQPRQGLAPWLVGVAGTAALGTLAVRAYRRDTGRA